MSTIKQIDGRTIHQIQSGQVIVDLCSVVKELLENSIDAGATSIDVRFRNQGLDLIEVQDNGTGISPENYPSVALKHHTSKLSSYSDIASLQTFGFRGEALASLCALSVLAVTTCQASEVPKGNRLSFEPSGKLKGTTIVAAQKGTTVSVEKLFHNLPVRRRELERNIKREWHKLIALLNQYACIQTNLKFSVSQQPTKGKRIHLFSTRGNPSTRENIINIFGAKTMTVLVPLALKLEMQPSVINKSLQVDNGAANASRDVHIVGHVSRPAHGDGRQTPDRQMFFVNGRPCGLPQFAKVFNEVYRAYNASQNPFILADIQLDTDLYDVNVSPDKRSILLHDQNDLLDTLRNSLISLFDSQDYSVPAAQLIKPHHRDITPANPTPSKVKLTPYQPASKGELDEDAESESEESATESPIITISLGRAKTIGSARSLSKDTSGQNLISRWIEKKPANQSASDQTPVSSRTHVPRIEATRPKASVNKRRRATEQIESSPEVSESEDDGKPMPVRDFNKRLAEFGTGPTRIAKKSAIPPSSSVDNDSENEEEEEKKVDDGKEEDHGSEPHIPAIQPQRRDQANRAVGTQLQSPHKRTMPEVTKIVIGDEVISDPANLSEDSNSETEVYDAGSKSSVTDQPKSSFGNRLTQLFSASQRKQSPNGFNEIMPVDEKSDSEYDINTINNINEEMESKHTAQRQPIVNESAHPGIGPSSKAPIRASEDSSSSVLGSRRRTDNNTSLNTSKSVETLDDVAGSNTIEQREQSFKSGVRKKDATLQIMQHVRIEESWLGLHMTNWIKHSLDTGSHASNEIGLTDLNAKDAEEKLSLTISKGDFSRMRIAGQFNLGFIIAVRPAKNDDINEPEPSEDDEMFIIDQHATDEKYNFERLQAITVVQSQRLVHPKRLELTALEEEIVIENIAAIEANGFKVHVDTSGEEPVGSRCQVLALPMSRETTFTLKDLEELISLLGDEPSESKHIPRPSKVRKMFAMRACRSSIMIGKPLTHGQMQTLVRHMGELDKPWNCPHGRPTMRHLCKLRSWDNTGWKGDQRGSKTSWKEFIQSE